MTSRSARKRIAAGIAAVLGGKIRTPKRLRPYQREALTAVGDWLKKASEPRAHVAHATGLGKTVLFSSIASAMGEHRLLVVVPTKPLLVQTARVLSGFANGQIGHVSSLGRIDDGDSETIATRGIAGSQIVVTTNASLRIKGEQLAREFTPDLVVYDECHWSYTDEIQAALKHFGPTPMLGVTATPDFMGTAARAGYVPVTLDNGQVLYGPRQRFAETHFGRRLDERTVRWGIENGWLAPLAWGLIEFDVSLDDLRTQDGAAGADYNEQDLHELLGRNWSAMVDTIRRLYKSGQYELAKRQVFSVCHSVVAAQELADAIRGVGVPSAVVVGTTNDAERDEILTHYRRDRIRFLSSVMVLREGWDSPNAEVCMMLRPTKSRVLYQQIMGRVLRKIDGRRKVALVLDARFQNTEFSPLCTPMLFGKPGSEVPEGDIILGPRDGGGSNRDDHGSPYLPQGAKPRLVVVDALTVEHWAEEDGTFQDKDGRWASVGALTEILGFSRTAIEAYISRAGVRRQPGRNRRGSVSVFYQVDDVRLALAELLNVRHRANERGEIRHDSEVWATAVAIAERWRMDHASVHKNLQKHCVPVITGFDRSGRVGSFYLLRQADQILSSRSKRPLLDEEGLAEVAQETCISIKGIQKRYGVSFGTAARVLAENGLKAAIGCLPNGRPVRLYRLVEVIPLFGSRESTERSADPDGVVRTMEDEWATAHSLAREYGIAKVTLLKYFEEGRVPWIRARDSRGHHLTYYSLKHGRPVLKGILRNNADENDILVVGGIEWTTVGAVARLHGCDQKKILARLAHAKIRSREALDCRRVKRVFYPKEKLLALLHDASADGDGILRIDGVEWVPKSLGAELCGCSNEALRLRIARGGVRKRRARSRNGNLITFYALSDLIAATKDVDKRRGRKRG